MLCLMGFLKSKNLIRFANHMKMSHKKESINSKVYQKKKKKKWKKNCKHIITFELGMPIGKSHNLKSRDFRDSQIPGFFKVPRDCFFMLYNSVYAKRN